VAVANGANGTPVDRNAEAATPELPEKAREAHRNVGVGPYVRLSGSGAITLPRRETTLKNGANRAINRAGQAARRPDSEPHHKGHSAMARRILSREEMFAKIKNVYPVVGRSDDAINFDAFGLVLDHGCDFYELFADALDQKAYAKEGRDIAPLTEFLLAKCWIESIAA
jgi:hypothetical protein